VDEAADSADGKAELEPDAPTAQTNGADAKPADPKARQDKPEPVQVTKPEVKEKATAKEVPVLVAEAKGKSGPGEAF
jgi:hypothetical protein